MGVQIFLATHNYVLLKEFELASSNEDNVLYHTLYRDENDVIAHSSTLSLDILEPNDIDETYSRILDDEIQKGLADL